MEATFPASPLTLSVTCTAAGGATGSRNTGISRHNPPRGLSHLIAPPGGERRDGIRAVDDRLEQLRSVDCSRVCADVVPLLIHVADEPIQGVVPFLNNATFKLGAGHGWLLIRIGGRPMVAVVKSA